MGGRGATLAWGQCGELTEGAEPAGVSPKEEGGGWAALVLRWLLAKKACCNAEASGASRCLATPGAQGWRCSVAGPPWAAGECKEPGSEGID